MLVSILFTLKKLLIKTYGLKMMNIISYFVNLPLLKVGLGSALNNKPLLQKTADLQTLFSCYRQFCGLWRVTGLCTEWFSKSNDAIGKVRRTISHACDHSRSLIRGTWSLCKMIYGILNCRCGGSDPEDHKVSRYSCYYSSGS